MFFPPFSVPFLSRPHNQRVSLIQKAPNSLQVADENLLEETGLSPSFLPRVAAPKNTPSHLQILSLHLRESSSPLTLLGLFPPSWEQNQLK